MLPSAATTTPLKVVMRTPFYAHFWM